jgi:hypothetical protein
MPLTTYARSGRGRPSADFTKAVMTSPSGWIETEGLREMAESGETAVGGHLDTNCTASCGCHHVAYPRHQVWAYSAVASATPVVSELNIERRAAARSRAKGRQGDVEMGRGCKARLDVEAAR